MIKVSFDISENGKTLILTLKGHAGMAEAGKDIVCASASIIAYTVAQEVTDMYNKGRLKKKPNIRLDEGDATITCKPVKTSMTEALHIYKVAQTGFRLLAESYPEYVQLTTFGSKA